MINAVPYLARFYQGCGGQFVYQQGYECIMIAVGATLESTRDSKSTPYERA